MDLQTIKVWKDGAAVVINESDLSEWEAQGWSREQAKPKATPKRRTKKSTKTND